jgi:AraC family transcriptional regulator of adaptative response/methylated-DNA-[protein]-cysteine methyltransferase
MDLTSRPLPSQKEMFEAFMHPKENDDKLFFVGVISSGVFNTATCFSKKPLKENMVFFSSTKEALDLGYRPCLQCQPMLANTDAPEKYKELLAEIDRDPSIEIEDEDLAKMDIDAKSIKAWFKQYHGISFQAYLRYQRINHLFGNIRVDKHPKIHRAYHIGEIVHGIEEGDSTETIVNKNIIYINRIATPIGPVLVGANDDGICLLEFSDRKILENQLKSIEKHFEAVLTPGESEYFTLLAKELDAYFKGELRTFTVPLSIAGTVFQENVWKSLIEIPYGQTRSYKEQSIALKNPKAIRAIAHANGENRIAILIPCHRIIGSDGDLVGYGGGLWRKRFLLDLENPTQFSMDF